MFKKTLPIAVILTMVLALLPSGFALAQRDAGVTLTSVMRQEEPITWYGVTALEISSFDPQRAQTRYDINATEQLFLGLTDINPLNPNEVRPELATSWEASEDGLSWTFTLRNDVNWVHWDPVTDTAEIVRPVTAADVAFGIKRSCDPRLGAYYTGVSASVILGCNDVATKPVEEVTDADYDLVQVEALDDTTLVVNLQFAAGYFFSMTPMWMLRPVPQETIAEFGDDWTDVGNIVTNGAWVLDEYIRGVRRVYLRNPHLPADMFGPGNVERVILTVVEDGGTQFALYLDKQADVGPLPTAEQQAVQDDPELSQQVVQVVDPSVGYIGFAHDKAPTDNVNVRRALGAMISRDALASQILQGRGMPVIHFTPPGMFGAPPINEVGVGFDPEFAQAQLAEAGYPNCEGLPTIEFVNTGGRVPEFLVAQAEENLGCNRDVFTLETVDFTVLIELTDPRNATEDRPNMWSIAWGPDYPDAQNWVGDVLHCESENTFKRPCSEVDDLIEQAARESDPEARTELYYRIEEMFFGPEGEHPIIPLYTFLTTYMVQPWATIPIATDGLVGGEHYDWRSIDVAMREAAMGE